MKYIITFLILFISAIGYSQQGNITGQRIQANSNLLPPLDTVLAPYRVGELRTKVSGADTLIFISISTTDPKKWKAYATSVSSGTQYQLTYYPSTGSIVNGLTIITASRALKSDANGLPIAFDTATEPSLAELAYVKGVTSAIQTQFGTKGTYAANGDGILTTFTVTHGYTGTPTNVQVTPAGVDSAIPLFVSNITGTTFDVTFTSAPIVGTNNVTFYWTAK